MSKYFLEKIFLNKYLMEFFENLILILVILTTGNFFLISLVLISCIYLGGAITTGNPAVVLSLYFANKLSTKEFIFFCIAEVGGCLIGFLIYQFFLKQN